ncbi:putative ribonuclease H-like domain-containing protein [Tanacetum coccineum]
MLLLNPHKQIITTNTLSNIKLPVLQKDDYDTWAMEMEHYLEYIDNEVWKVIQNGNSKKRVTKGKDGVSGRFHGMDEPKRSGSYQTTESLEKGYDRFQKLLSQLDALGASVSDEDANHKFLRSLPPAWDSLAMTMRTKKNIDTLSIDDLYNNLSVFEQDIQKTSSSSLASDNVAFISQAKVSSSKHKPSHSSGSYSSYTTSSSKATPTATPGLADEVIHSFLATNADDVDLIHEDLDQIDDLDLEEMDINWQIAMTAIKIKKFYKKTGRRPRVDGKMHVAFDKRKVECFNCHNTGHFARECKFKGTKDGSRQEASRGQEFKPVRTEKEALMTIDEGQINWYGIKSNAEVLGYEEEISRGIFAFRERDAGNYQIPLYSRFKQVEYKGVPHPLSGDYTPREQEDIDDSLYEYGKHGPQPKSPSPTVSNASSIVFSICPSHDSDGELGTVFNANSTVYSSCQSNDSDGEQGTISDHSVQDNPTNIPSIEQVTIATQKTQPQVPEPQQTVDPSCAQHVKTPRQPIRTPVTPSPISSYNRQNWNQRMERELGAGYSFVRKPCFVCGSLSHLIKDCDYYEKKMAREAALKSKRVIHVDAKQARPAWTNTNRVNKANQFTPRPVQLSNIRPNFSTASRTIKTGRVNVNTGKQNVSSGRLHVSSGTHIKSGTSSFNTGKQHVNSGSMYVNSGTKNKSGGSRVNTGNQNVNSGRVTVNAARVNRPVLSNQTSQVNIKSPKKCFSKQNSPINRPFSRTTAHKSNKYAVKGKMGTAVKTSAGCVWRKTTLHSNINSGPTPDSNIHVSQGSSTKAMAHRGIFDSGCSGHMTGNRAHLEDYQELSKVGSVTFGGSKGSISGKGPYRAARDYLADSLLPTTFWAEASILLAIPQQVIILLAEHWEHSSRVDINKTQGLSFLHIR